MPKQSNPQANAQAAWGQWFRQPGLTTQPKSVPDNRNKNLAATLSSASPVPLATTTLDQQDIITGLAVQITIAETYTPGVTGDRTVTLSDFFPYNWVQMATLNLESSYNAYQQPGIIGFVMQSYRPMQQGGAGRVGVLTAAGSNAQQGNTVSPALTPSLTAAGLTGAAVYSSQTVHQPATYTTGLNLSLEIPLAATFDIYYEFDPGGGILWADTRRIVTPQYMAATERSVTPLITFAPGLLVQTGGTSILAPATVVSGDVTSTFAGSSTATIFRKGYFSPNDPRTIPPVNNWQYARGYFTVPTNGQQSVAIPLASDPVGQGQILSFVFFLWDPALNSGRGGVTPYTNYDHVELQTSSSVINDYDTISQNSGRWLQQHGTLLPPGWWGFDRAITDDAQFTNEFAINTLTTTGVQAVVQFNAGSAPSATSTLYVGVELLKYVPTMAASGR